MSHAASSVASQPSSARLSNAVREAWVWSVRWERPSVRFHRIHVSTVPTAISPRRARAAKPSTFSTYQASFGAVKYESLLSPVRARTSGSRPAARHRRTMSSVWCDIHMIPLCTGAPVPRSQANAVSRWR